MNIPFFPPNRTMLNSLNYEGHCSNLGYGFTTFLTVTDCVLALQTK